MGFFAEFNTWLNALLATYIGDNTARVAELLTPAIVTLAVLYVMVWGYLQLMGQTDEPFVAGLKRIVMLAVILVIVVGTIRLIGSNANNVFSNVASSIQ